MGDGKNAQHLGPLVLDLQNLDDGENESTFASSLHDLLCFSYLHGDHDGGVHDDHDVHGFHDDCSNDDVLHAPFRMILNK